MKKWSKGSEGHLHGSGYRWNIVAHATDTVSVSVKGYFHVNYDIPSMCWRTVGRPQCLPLDAADMCSSMARLQEFVRLMAQLKHRRSLMLLQAASLNISGHCSRRSLINKLPSTHRLNRIISCDIDQPIAVARHGFRCFQVGLYTPLLKNADLDLTVLASCRPISNLKEMSKMLYKIWERIAARQMLWSPAWSSQFRDDQTSIGASSSLNWGYFPILSQHSDREGCSQDAVRHLTINEL